MGCCPQSPRARAWAGSLQQCTHLLRSTCLYRARLFPKYFLSEPRASTWAAQVPCFSHSCLLRVQSRGSGTLPAPRPRGMPLPSPTGRQAAPAMPTSPAPGTRLQKQARPQGLPVVPLLPTTQQLTPAVGLLGGTHPREEGNQQHRGDAHPAAASLL